MESTTPKLTFISPATYRIYVQGFLNKDRSDYLQGMVISHEYDQNQHLVSVFSGQLLDQAALLGVLNALYSYHLPILSVECLSIDHTIEEE